MFGLVEGNNFYASCERVFQPAPRGVPLVVLSNNDGCAIARSAEAKALGIQQDLAAAHAVAELYDFGSRAPAGALLSHSECQ